MIYLTGDLIKDRNSRVIDSLMKIDLYENSQEILDYVFVKNLKKALRHINKETDNKVFGVDDLVVLYCSLVLE